MICDTTSTGRYDLKERIVSLVTEHHQPAGVLPGDWRNALRAAHGFPRRVCGRDNIGAILRALEVRESVHPADVVVSVYQNARAQQAYAAAMLEHYGHQTIATQEHPDGEVVAVLDLRRALNELGLPVVDPSKPDHDQ